MIKPFELLKDHFSGFLTALAFILPTSFAIIEFLHFIHSFCFIIIFQFQPSFVLFISPFTFIFMLSFIELTYLFSIFTLFLFFISIPSILFLFSLLSIFILLFFLLIQSFLFRRLHVFLLIFFFYLQQFDKLDEVFHLNLIVFFLLFAFPFQAHFILFSGLSSFFRFIKIFLFFLLNLLLISISFCLSIQ